MAQSIMLPRVMLAFHIGSWMLYFQYNGLLMYLEWQQRTGKCLGPCHIGDQDNVPGSLLQMEDLVFSVYSIFQISK